MTGKPLYKSVPTFRNYEDYHGAEQYTHGWNDAMDYIFPEAKKPHGVNRGASLQKASSVFSLRGYLYITADRPKKQPCFKSNMIVIFA